MNYSFKYSVYSKVSDLEEIDSCLAKAAIEAARNSYAPYSHFNVGAVVRLANGIVIKGANQENVAYPDGLCAERVAMYAAGGAYPDIPIESIAIAGGPDHSLTDDPVTPCGSCRQVMTEFRKRSGMPISVILVGRKKVIKLRDVIDLLPFSFDI